MERPALAGQAPQLKQRHPVLTYPTFVESIAGRVLGRVVRPARTLYSGWGHSGWIALRAEDWAR